MSVKFKKIITLILIIFIITPSVFLGFPKKTEAFGGDIVLDPYNLVQNVRSAISDAGSYVLEYDVWFKEIILDGILYAGAQLALQQMISSTIEWANTGFNGSPSFITDFDSFLTNIGDVTLGEMINGSELDFLCSPFKLQIKNALYNGYTKKYDPKCTLSQVTDNIEGAIDDLGNEWNWDVWNSVTQSSSNNAYSAYIDASITLNSRIKKKQDIAKAEVDWGSGFKPFKECEDVDTGDGNIETLCENKTPGDVIANAINDSLGRGGDALVQADEINELVGALLTGFLNKVLSDGLSSFGGGGDNNDYLNDLRIDETLSDRLGDDIDQGLDVAIENENKYKIARNILINMTNQGEEKIDILKTCIIQVGNIYPPDSESLFNDFINNSSNSFITFNYSSLRTQLDNVSAGLQSDIDSATFNINTLTNIKNDITNNISSIEEGLTRYQEVQNSGVLHSGVEVIQAQIDADRTRGTRLETAYDLNRVIDRSINRCQNYDSND